ncbi:hypothetical protein Q3G72_008638 [Acer saccharum]|nr:hypothetical protein Q3G72_008638 [Acer saccharum]
MFIKRLQGSLLDLLTTNAWLSRVEAAHHRCFIVECPRTRGSADWSDDACMVYGDGGELICCQKCASTFHYSCMHMKFTRIVFLITRRVIFVALHVKRYKCEDNY